LALMTDGLISSGQIYTALESDKVYTYLNLKQTESTTHVHTFLDLFINDTSQKSNIVNIRENIGTSEFLLKRYVCYIVLTSFIENPTKKNSNDITFIERFKVCIDWILNRNSDQQNDPLKLAKRFKEELKTAFSPKTTETLATKLNKRL
jgi:hypothetical protein